MLVGCSRRVNAHGGVKALAVAAWYAGVHRGCGCDCFHGVAWSTACCEGPGATLQQNSNTASRRRWTGAEILITIMLEKSGFIYIYSPSDFFSLAFGALGKCSVFDGGFGVGQLPRCDISCYLFIYGNVYCFLSSFGRYVGRGEGHAGTRTRPGM